VLVALVPYVLWVSPAHREAILGVLGAAAAAHVWWWLYLRRGGAVARGPAVATIMADTVAIGIGVSLVGGIHSPAIFLWGINLTASAVWLGLVWTLPALAVSCVWLIALALIGVGETTSLTDAQYATLAGGTIFALVLLTGLIAQRQRLALAAAETRARTDALTGLANRAAFEERLGQEIERVVRYGHPLSLALLDLDDFKRINDSYGHVAGDHALRRVSRELDGAIRRVDLAARLGGEEFALLLPETDTDAALALVTRLGGAIRLPATAGPGLTVSAGVATCPAHADRPEALVAAADEALYRAKRSGKDRAVVAVTLAPAKGDHASFA
jgi:diguanylate cyclase (GGDEF)-like protein